MLICSPCLAVRQAQPDTLLACTTRRTMVAVGLSSRRLRSPDHGPWYLEGHTAAEHPGWTAIYELLRPCPNQRQWVVYRRNEPPAS